MLSGLVVGLIISRMTEYYTSGDYSPVKKVAKNHKLEQQQILSVDFQWA